MFRPQAASLLGWGLVAVAVTGCGARVAPGPGVGPLPDVAAVSPGATAGDDAPSSAGGPAGPSGQPPDAAGQTAAATAGQPQAPAGPEAEEKVARITLQADCYEAGDTVPVLLEGPPRASFAMSTAFEGWDQPGPKILGFTDDRGQFRWSFPIPPTTEPGRGWVSAAVSGADFGPGGGVDQVVFHVAAPGGC